MDTILKADIFFFVTTLAIVILTVAGIIIMLYVWKIVRNIKDISEHAKEEAMKMFEEIREVKSPLKSLIKGIISMGGIFKKTNKKRNEKRD